MCKGFREKWINLSNAKVDQNTNFLMFIHFFQKCAPPGIQPIYIFPGEINRKESFDRRNFVHKE